MIPVSSGVRIWLASDNMEDRIGPRVSRRVAMASMECHTAQFIKVTTTIRLHFEEFIISTILSNSYFVLYQNDMSRTMAG